MTVVTDYTALLSDSSWNGLAFGTPRIVTYSFLDAAPSYLTDAGYSSAFANSFEPFSAQDELFAEEAFAQFAAASGLIFVEVDPGEGEINLGKYDFSLDPGNESFSGFAWYPGTEAEETYSWYSDISGDVFINTNRENSQFLMLHEIGHALGLKHPFDGDPTLDSSLDFRTNTVMSYTGATSSVLGYLDIDAVEYIYGPSTFAPGTLLSWSYDDASDILIQDWGAVSNEIHGTTQHDWIDAGAGNDTVAGHDGDDSLSGGDGADILFGGSGDDLLAGGPGADALYGGRYWGAPDGGIDTVDYAASAATIEVWLAGHWDGEGWVYAQGADIGSDKLYDIEHVLSGAGDDTITGSAAANSIHGNAGMDTIYGGNGDDILSGDGGNDAIFGGDGLDTLIGGSGNDALTGGNGADRFFGGDGVSDLMITGDDGALDHFDGGAGIADVVSYFSSGNGVTVNLANNAANTGAAAGETYTGVEGIRGAGSAANTLIGDAGGNVLVGGSGGDWISSGGGSDIIYGGAGDDTLLAGNAIDIIRGDQGDDTLTGGAGGDIFKMKGVDGNDTITDFAVLSDKVEFQVAGVTGFGDLVFQDLGGGDSKVTAGTVSITFLGVALADIQLGANFDFV